MTERPWKIATAVATTAFVTTAVWGAIGWTRVPTAAPAAAILEQAAAPSSPSPKEHPDRTTYIGNMQTAPTAPPPPPTTSDLTEAQMDRARKIVQQEHLDERVDRRDAYVDDVHDALQRFADNEQLDPSTADTIFDIFDAGLEYRRAQREQVRSGQRTRWEARQAIRDNRQASEDRLIELVGEDGMTRLQESLPGWGGRRGRSDSR